MYSRPGVHRGAPDRALRPESHGHWEFRDVVFEDVVFDNNSSVAPY